MRQMLNSQMNALVDFHYIFWLYSYFYMREGTFGRIMLWRISSVRLVLAKSCPLIYFNLILSRFTFLCIMNGHDP